MLLLRHDRTLRAPQQHGCEAEKAVAVMAEVDRFNSSVLLFLCFPNSKHAHFLLYLNLSEWRQLPQNNGRWRARAASMPSSSMRRLRYQRLATKTFLSKVRSSHDVYSPITDNVPVHAASLNYRDLIIPKGKYPFPMKDNIVPGSDGAGIVESVGKNVTRFKPGGNTKPSQTVSQSTS